MFLSNKSDFSNLIYIEVNTTRMEEQIHSAHNTESSLGNSKRQYGTIFKFVIIFLMIVGFLLYRFLYSVRDVECIYDAYHELTINANRDLVNNRAKGSYEGNDNELTVAGKGFIGAGQVMIDLAILIMGLGFFVKIKNLRAGGTFGLFFLIRAVVFLNVQQFPFPKFIAWRSPGFIAFTVPYDHTRDFFYSGHTGTLTILFLQLMILDLKVAAFVAFLSLIFMMNMLLITQVHYIADIIGGLVFAVWCHRQCTRWVVWIDKFMSLPLVFGQYLKKKCCGEPQPEQLEQPQIQLRTSQRQRRAPNKQVIIQMQNDNIEDKN